MLDHSRAPGVKVALVYVFPNLKRGTYEPMARRFCESYQEFPPGETGHSLHVAVNGGPLDDRQCKLFNPLPVEFHQHDNSGRDIGAYVKLSKSIPCDLMVCLGSPIHFWRAGWLDRMLDVYLSVGPGLYGPWGFRQPFLHLRTTAFWLPPELLSSYPHPVDDQHRYEFERGQQLSITAWTQQNGLPVSVVGWRSVLACPDFEPLPDRELLMLDQHCRSERPSWT